MTTISLSVRNLRKQVHEALKLLGREGSATSPLNALYLYKMAERSDGAEGWSATRRLIEQGLDHFADGHQLDAQILRLHFMEGAPVQAIASRLSMAEGTIFKQGQATTKLAELLYEMEQFDGKVDI